MASSSINNLTSSSSSGGGAEDVNNSNTNSYSNNTDSDCVPLWKRELIQRRKNLSKTIGISSNGSSGSIGWSSSGNLTTVLPTSIQQHQLSQKGKKKNLAILHKIPFPFSLLLPFSTLSLSK